MKHRKIYGISSKGKFGVVTNKADAIAYVKKHSGKVFAMPYGIYKEAHGVFDAPSFKAYSKIIFEK